MTRIQWRVWVLLAAVLAGFPALAEEGVWDRGAPVLGKPVEITVYRSPSCGCCGKWLEHMERHGFIVKDIRTEAMDQIKRRYGIPESLQSCHTAVVEGYVVEGHVPAADVGELLKRKPPVTGLAVPGMVTGSPGMEMGGKKEPFAVLEFARDGSAQIFHEYRSY